MSVSNLYFRVRDKLVDWGLISRPRFYMQRHAAGATRNRLALRGARRFRRRAPARLLVEI
jgi:hypothetical protein